MLAAVFSSCAKPVDASIAGPFSVYRTKDGIRFTLGDKREAIEEALNDTPQAIFEYEDETPQDQIFELIIYEYIELGYDRAGTALKIRIKDADWQIENGLKITSSTEDVKGKYPKEHMHTYKQNNDIYISYDENGNTIEFSEESPYVLRFVIESYAVKAIVIEKNIPLA